MGTLFCKLEIIALFAGTWFHKNWKFSVTINVKFTIVWQFNFANLRNQIAAKINLFYSTLKSLGHVKFLKKYPQNEIHSQFLFSTL